MWRSRLLQAALVAVTVAVVPNAAAAAGFAPATQGQSGIPAGSRELGAVAHNRTVHAAVALAPRDAAGLAAYAQGVSTPGSPLYHHYLSVSGFAARFAPNAAQVAAVRASLVKDGLAPGTISANGLTLPVTATAGTVETAFATTLHRFALPNGQSAIANTTAPSIDPGVAGLVQGIVGLNTLAPTTPRIIVAHTKPAAAHAVSAGADAGGCSAARARPPARPATRRARSPPGITLNDSMPPASRATASPSPSTSSSPSAPPTWPPSSPAFTPAPRSPR